MYRNILLPVLLIFCLLINARVAAKPVSQIPFKVFPISTEVEIGRRLQPILAHAPAGALVTVGGDRGFREAGVLPGVDYVFLIDIANDVLRFVAINIKLLRAPTLELYKHLRWTASFQEWQHVDSTLTVDDFAWWTAHVRDLDSMDYRLSEELYRYGSVREVAHFLELKGRKERREKLSPQETAWLKTFLKDHPFYKEKPDEAVDLGQVLDYKTGNYLFDPVQYDRVHRLAIAERIIPLKLNLTISKDRRRLIEEIRFRKTQIAVLDLDNLHWKDYTKPGEYHAMIDAFLPLGQNDAILVVMKNSKERAGGQMQAYLGFTFENIREWPKTFDMRTFCYSLPKWLYDFLDGRLYKKGEMPPLHFMPNPKKK